MSAADLLRTSTEVRMDRAKLAEKVEEVGQLLNEAATGKGPMVNTADALRALAELKAIGEELHDQDVVARAEMLSAILAGKRNDN
jgi:hypothetical protein